MKDSVEKLKIRMSRGEQEWWEGMIKEEEQKVTKWDSLKEEDYRKARETFDLLDFRYTEPEPAAKLDDDAEYKERDQKLLLLLEKKENHQPVSKQY